MLIDFDIKIYRGYGCQYQVMPIALLITDRNLQSKTQYGSRWLPWNGTLNG